MLVTGGKNTVLVVREPSLDLERFLPCLLASSLSQNNTLSRVPFSNTLSGPQFSFIRPRAPGLVGGRAQNSLLDQLESLDNKAQALVPLPQVTKITPTIHCVVQNTSPTAVPPQLEEVEEDNSSTGSQSEETTPETTPENQMVPTVCSSTDFPHQLDEEFNNPPQLEENLSQPHQLEETFSQPHQLEREQLGRESDSELDMPAEVPSPQPLSLNNSSTSFETDYQEPPRKIARLGGGVNEYWEEVTEEADDGSSTADQAVPGSGCAAQGHSPPASLSPCRQRRGGGGRGEGGGSGKLVCGDHQVVPSDREDTEELSSLYGHHPPSEEKYSVVEREDEGVWSPSSLRRYHSCYHCSRGREYSAQEVYPTTVQLNLSRPRLRLGLSKCQRPRQPLHHSRVE